MTLVEEAVQASQIGFPEEIGERPVQPMVPQQQRVVQRSVAGFVVDTVLVPLRVTVLVLVEETTKLQLTAPVPILAAVPLPRTRIAQRVAENVVVEEFEDRPVNRARLGRGGGVWGGAL